MRVTRQHTQRLTLEQMGEFVASSGSLSFTGADRKEIYDGSLSAPKRFRREQCQPERRSARSINVCERMDEPPGAYRRR